MAENTVNFAVEEELKKISAIFKNLEKESFYAQKKAISTGSTYVAQQVRRDYGAWFPHTPKHHDKSGMPGLAKGEPENLKKSIRSKTYKRKKLGAYITSTVHAWNPYSPDQNKVLYGIALGKGFTIHPKDPEGYLTFLKPDGKWAKRKEVTIQGRPWITNPAERAANSSEVIEKMDMALQKQLDKLDKDPRYTVQYPDMPDYTV